jgi:glycosyltransferase involved in cell wall biosynthesis
LQDASDLDIRKGTIDHKKTSLFSIVKDDMFFMNAFFNHYRSIGVEQFVIVDDGSTDGTLEFLLGQPDCVVLKSDIGYNQSYFTLFKGEQLRMRRGNASLKNIVPHAIAPGDYVLYVDADEFLVLPEPFESLEDLILHVRRRSVANVVAGVIEMFPDYLSRLDSFDAAPTCLDDLLAEAPYFEGRPMVELLDEGRYRIAAPTKTFSLLEKHVGLENVDQSSRRAVNGVRHKTPLMLSIRGNYRIDSHTATMPVDDSIILGLLHFVYNRNLKSKIDRVLEWGTYAHGGRKYAQLAELFKILEDGNVSLLSHRSKRFSSRQDLQECGIIQGERRSQPQAL